MREGSGENNWSFFWQTLYFNLEYVFKITAYLGIVNLSVNIFHLLDNTGAKIDFYT
jgi:hypothetical protein